MLLRFSRRKLVFRLPLKFGVAHENRKQRASGAENVLGSDSARGFFDAGYFGVSP